MPKTAVIVRILSRNSVNRKLAEGLASLAKPETELVFLKIDDLPPCSEHLEPNSPATVTRLKREIEAADSVLFVTQHHSIPEVFQNPTQTHDALRPLRRVPKGGLAPWQERRAKERIDANLSGNISLSALAADCGLSLSHFSRAFRESTGMPPTSGDCCVEWMPPRR